MFLYASVEAGISSVVHSLLLLPALVMGFFFFFIVCHTSQIFLPFLTEFEEAYYSSVHSVDGCCTVLNERIVLYNLRDIAKSDFSKINSRDSCSDLAGIWRHTHLIKSQKYKFSSFLLYWDAMFSCREKKIKIRRNTLYSAIYLLVCSTLTQITAHKYHVEISFLS